MRMRVLLSSAALCLAMMLSGCGTSVPDLKGLTCEQATETLTDAGFELGHVTYREDAQGAVGAVISQDPDAGSRRPSGSAVDIVIAGPEPIPVPDLVGLSESEAEAVLSAVGLAMSVSDETSVGPDPGTVVAQDPGPDQRVAPGSTVTVVLSVSDEDAIGERPDSGAAVLEPKMGTAERTALMDAARAYLGISNQFLVWQLFVHDDHAVADITPVGGGQRNLVSFVRENGRWQGQWHKRYIDASRDELLAASPSMSLRLANAAEFMVPIEVDPRYAQAGPRLERAAWDTSLRARVWAPTRMPEGYSVSGQVTFESSRQHHVQYSASGKGLIEVWHGIMGDWGEMETNAFFTDDIRYGSHMGWLEDPLHDMVVTGQYGNSSISSHVVGEGASRGAVAAVAESMVQVYP